MDLLSSMQLYVKVVESGGFTSAARAVGLPKSSVSRQIAGLEEHLGVRLLERTTRALRPTDLGRAFYERAVRIVADVADAEASVTHMQAEPQGELRVSAPVSLGMRRLGPLFAQWAAAHPKVRLTVSLSDRRVDLIEEGFDVAVRVGVLPDSSLIARRLGPAPMVVAASPAYVATHGAPTAPEDLTRHACLLYEYARIGGWRFREGAREATVTVSGPVTSNNGEILRDAAVAGLGITVAPAWILEDALASGQLVALLTGYEVPGGAIWAVYPEHRYQSAKVRSFVDAMSAGLSEP